MPEIAFNWRDLIEAPEIRAASHKEFRVRNTRRRFVLALLDVDFPDRRQRFVLNIVHLCNNIAVNDSELALLALIAELEPASGYGLASVARTRRMERWAGLSASSVYKGLRRLDGQGLVKGRLNRKKVGKGPPGRVFTLTESGSRLVRRELAQGLRTAPEQSTRYRLSLAFAELVGLKAAAEQLEKRLRSFRERIRDVERARTADDGASMGASLLFEYVLGGLEQERVVTARLIQILNSRGRS